MIIFVDTSAWYAAVDSGDPENRRAKAILSSSNELLTSSFVVFETWTLIRNRMHWRRAEDFLTTVLSGAVAVEIVQSSDIEAARLIAIRYPDQEFSLSDRTSFALMERLGLRAVASFDRDFAVYRFGRRNAEAFEVLR